MSWTACDCHGRTYTGRSSTCYSALVEGEKRHSKKLKLCPEGLSDLLGRAGRFLSSSEGFDGSLVDLFEACGWCGQPRGKSGAAVFLTVYKLGKTREDFAGCACEEHLVNARSDTLIAV
jgi:hypothetical protein